MSLYKLSAVEDLANPAPVIDDNSELVDRHLFGRNPTLVSGVATTLIGAPTANAHLLNEVWTDALLGQFLCTVAGTPGTWVQISPAPRQSDPSSGTIATGYLIVRTDLFGLIRRHAGSYVWADVSINANNPGSSFRFKDGQVQYWDAVAYAADNTKPWRALSVSDGMTVWSAPISD